MKRYICFLFTAAFGITTLHATPDLNGAWTATVEYNKSFYTYTIHFSADGRCTVQVSNDSASQETARNWSYDGTLLRLNATFRNAKIAYLPNIAWASVVNFSLGNNSFNILGKATTNGPAARITFFRTGDSLEVSFNEKAIPQIFDTLSVNVPLGSRVAVVGITAENTGEAAFYVNELTVNFVSSKKYTVVDRSNIDKVLSEQDFQMSGYVDDEEFVSIGKFIGATVIVTGDINGTGSEKRLVIKAIDVLTSEIISMVSVVL